jgi:hypothetical protein
MRHGGSSLPQRPGRPAVPTPPKAKRAPASGQGQRSAQKARGTGTKLTATQQAEKRAELTKWKAERDALFTEYKLTARAQGRNA